MRAMWKGTGDKSVQAFDPVGEPACDEKIQSPVDDSGFCADPFARKPLHDGVGPECSALSGENLQNTAARSGEIQTIAGAMRFGFGNQSGTKNRAWLIPYLHRVCG